MQFPHQSFRLAGGLAPGVSDLSTPKSILSSSYEAMQGQRPCQLASAGTGALSSP